MKMNISLYDIEKVWVVGDSLKVKLKNSPKYKKSEVIIPIKITPSETLIWLIGNNLLDARETTEKIKQKIKKDLIEGKTTFGYTDREIEAFKRLFTPDDFGNEEFKKLSFYISGDLMYVGWITNGALEIVNYLNKKEIFKEQIKKEIIKKLDDITSAISFYPIDAFTDCISIIYEYYPELRDELSENKKIMKKVELIAEIARKNKWTGLLKKLIKEFRLKRYLVEVL
jgi:hypothetical protein